MFLILKIFVFMFVSIANNLQVILSLQIILLLDQGSSKPVSLHQRVPSKIVKNLVRKSTLSGKTTFIKMLMSGKQ